MPVDINRDAAVDVLLRVFERGWFLDEALDRTIRRRNLPDRGRRFLTQIVYGVVRHKTLCDHILRGLVHQSIDDLPLPILIVLRMGVFQALFLNQVTFPAMVHTSVDLAKKRGHAGTAKLVNAVLKRVPKSLEEVELPEPGKGLAAYLHLRYSMPMAFIQDWQERFGDERAEALCRAMTEEAPSTIRVNTLKITPDDLIQRMAKADIHAYSSTSIPEELTLETSIPPGRSKLFQHGLYMAQDPASMLAAHLMEPEGGQKILDLCAAPGGKSTHMAALAKNAAAIVAADARLARLKLVAENSARLGASSISTVCSDGLKPGLAAGEFDKILVDAPCSGLGTLRRHPDLKWRAEHFDFDESARLQQDLLRSAIQLCKNGGLIVYAVCTFTRQETTHVIDSIVASGDVETEDGPEWLNSWKIAKGRYLSLPTGGLLDGFFLTRLRKRF